MRAGRLLQLLLILERRGSMTAARLADELEVSVRTIYRDVEALGTAGVPVYTESGPGGGVRLVDGYRSRLGGLTVDETAALGLANMPTVADQLGLGSLLVAAHAKVDGSLPTELRARASRIRDRFLVDAPGWFRAPDEVPCLPVLSDAVWTEHRVDLRYRRGERVVHRVVDPLGLVLKAGVWYLVAHAGRPAAARTFRVGRIISATARSERFVRSPTLDLAQLWAASNASFATDLLTMEVMARVPHASLWRLRFAVTEEAAARAAASAGPPDVHGWCEVRIPAESIEIAHDELLRMGTDIEVVAPVQLRSRLAETATILAARHAAPTGR